MMLDYMSRKILRTMRKHHANVDHGHFTYSMLQELTGLNEADVRRCIECLEGKKLIKVRRPQGIESFHTFVFLSHEGKHYPEFFLNNTVIFLFKSIVVPILVSVITTLVTLWISGVFSLLPE